MADPLCALNVADSAPVSPTAHSSPASTATSLTLPVFDPTAGALNSGLSPLTVAFSDFPPS